MPTPHGEDVTLAVLGERLDGALSMLGEVRRDQKEQSQTLSALMALSARVASLEAWQTWALRAVVGLVIAGCVAAAWTR